MEYNRNTCFSAFYHIVFSTKNRQRFLEGSVKTNLLNSTTRKAMKNLATPYVIHPADLRISEEGITFLPLYMTPLL